jgi:thiosulfate/3-mercaptopyruvate sulfurtransferase
MRAVVPPETLDVDHARLVDVRSSPAYAAGHLRGAVHADLERDLSGTVDDPARGGRHPLPDPAVFGATLGAWGIDPHTPVVAYDAAGGANAAARLWWMLRALGHQRVAVLDGGWAAAVAAGLPVETSEPNVETKPPYPVIGFRSPIVDIAQVESRVGRPGWIVLDVRSAERFRGEAEPIDPVAGHIPGAVNVFFGENLGPDGRFLPPDALAARYRALLGDLPPERLIVSCGSGVTACHTLAALEIAGLPGAALYVGSWSEWCRSDRARESSPT